MPHLFCLYYTISGTNIFAMFHIWNTRFEHYSISGTIIGLRGLWSTVWCNMRPRTPILCDMAWRTFLSCSNRSSSFIHCNRLTIHKLTRSGFCCLLLEMKCLDSMEFVLSMKTCCRYPFEASHWDASNGYQQQLVWLRLKYTCNTHLLSKTERWNRYTRILP